ncbi:hypothetical protein TNCV_251221 [Trichonephila clavipes]|nr:hypothetical protein TNCV_251221 [Trichonephila clavipes]
MRFFPNNPRVSSESDVFSHSPAIANEGSREIRNITKPPVLIHRRNGNFKISEELLEIIHVCDAVMEVLKKYKSHTIGKSWRKGTNLEIYKLFKQPDIVKFIAIQKLRWAGHVMLDDNQVTKKKDHMYVDKPFGTRKSGSARLRTDQLPRKDLKNINVRKKLEKSDEEQDTLE